MEWRVEVSSLRVEDGVCAARRGRVVACELVAEVEAIVAGIHEVGRQSSSKAPGFDRRPGSRIDVLSIRRVHGLRV